MAPLSFVPAPPPFLDEVAAHDRAPDVQMVVAATGGRVGATRRDPRHRERLWGHQDSRRENFGPSPSRRASRSELQASQPGSSPRGCYESSRGIRPGPAEAPAAESAAREAEGDVAPLAQPLLAHVKDLGSGEISLFQGEQETVVRNPALARQLFTAVRR